MNIETYKDLLFCAKLTQLHIQKIDEYFKSNGVDSGVTAHLLQIECCQERWMDAVRDDLLIRYDFEEDFKTMIRSEEENAQEHFDARSVRTRWIW